MKNRANFSILTGAEAEFHAPSTEETRSLTNTDDALAVPLHGVTRVDLHFPAFTDGRAYSQAHLLRRRRGFEGDIRATGDVRVDQLAQMRRCGFSSAVLIDGQDLAVAERELARFDAHYQGDAQQPLPRFATATTAAAEDE